MFIETEKRLVCKSFTHVSEGGGGGWITVFFFKKTK
jgi:hypothetical protein